MALSLSPLLDGTTFMVFHEIDLQYTAFLDQLSDGQSGERLAEGPRRCILILKY